MEETPGSGETPRSASDFRKVLRGKVAGVEELMEGCEHAERSPPPDGDLAGGSRGKCSNPRTRGRCSNLQTQLHQLHGRTLVIGDCFHEGGGFSGNVLLCHT